MTMKNPWMSAWLSAANKAAAPARGAVMAEARRQQKSFADQWMKSLTGGLSGTTAKRRTRKK
jgi:uncharacterized membrane protein